MTIFMAWPEIEAFYNIRKYASAHPEILNGNSKVNYRIKCKLHGTNSAVQCHNDGTLVCQSRETIITPEKDNAGFARWVDSNKSAWQQIKGWIIYGEWVGPGIQKGVAVSQLPKKAFAVFAARLLEENDMLITDPAVLGDLVFGIPDTYVLPWYARPTMHGSDTQVNISFDIDWALSSEELVPVTDEINKWVMEVEANDPWVKSVFGIDGVGEGLVFYPSSREHIGWENYKNLTFKAKGDKHKNIATAKPAQVSAESAANVDAFVALVLTDARLEQGAGKVALTTGSYDQSQTGKFVSWIVSDVEKEAQDELAASNLEWKAVLKLLQTKARTWYLEKAKR
jgi:hypothetical protein